MAYFKATVNVSGARRAWCGAAAKADRQREGGSTASLRLHRSTRPRMKENANRCRQGMTNRVGDKINGSENRPGILSRGDTDVNKKGIQYCPLYLLFLPFGMEILLRHD